MKVIPSLCPIFFNISLITHNLGCQSTSDRLFPVIAVHTASHAMNYMFFLFVSPSLMYIKRGECFITFSP